MSTDRVAEILKAVGINPEDVDLCIKYCQGESTPDAESANERVRAEILERLRSDRPQNE